MIDIYTTRTKTDIFRKSTNVTGVAIPEFGICTIPKK